MNMRYIHIFLFTFILSAASAQKTIVDTSLGMFFDYPGLTGSFCLYDLDKEEYILYNPEQFHREFSPASTFKICNSLIGLETGVITDEHYVIKWDSIKRGNLNWDTDNDLASAFRYSVVWYYQELARRVGEKRMQEWVSRANYGNENTGGGIDKFWLRGDLRITPAQQLDFLVRLYKNELPFSRRTMDIVKKVMVVEQTNKYILRAKTGWAFANSAGWYVGWVESNHDVYFFTTCVQGGSDFNMTDFGKYRIEISRNILREMKILP